MEEEYKVIEECNNYEISNLGNVRNIKTGRILKSRDNTDGYLILDLFVNGKRKSAKIHRLVAEAFIPNLENKECVDHIDRIRNNNNVNNLRWATRSENSINKKIQSNNTSGCSGVSYCNRSKKWIVAIKINKRNKHIGYYNNFDEAVKIRKEQEEIYYKEFRAIN